MMPMPVTCSCTNTLILATSLRTLTKAFLIAFWNTRVAKKQHWNGKQYDHGEAHIDPEHGGQ